LGIVQIRPTQSVVGISSNTPDGSRGIVQAQLTTRKDENADAPRIQLSCYIQVRSRRADVFKPFSCRLDLNNPPTAVGGIRVDRRLRLVSEQFTDCRRWYSRRSKTQAR
jgi:hypothetical protein